MLIAYGGIVNCNTIALSSLPIVLCRSHAYMKNPLSALMAWLLSKASFAQKWFVSARHLQYFGYAMVDCGYDDPLDDDTKTNYLAEVAPFSNIAQLCIYQPTDNIVERLAGMSQSGVKAMLAIPDILFSGVPDSSTGSGMRFTLRTDYKARWEQLLTVNREADLSAIAAFYLVDEPTWNGIAFEDLKIASDMIKMALPRIPIALIEAWPAIDTLQVPRSVDWIGFDHYGITRPATDAAYLDELDRLKDRRSRKEQKILITMEARWLPDYAAIGIQAADMAAVATSYYDLARSDQDVIGLLGYVWAGGLGNPAELGARELPANVQAEYQRIGKLITGK